MLSRVVEHTGGELALSICPIWNTASSLWCISIASCGDGNGFVTSSFWRVSDSLMPYIMSVVILELRQT